jgi:hypothetical protein
VVERAGLLSLMDRIRVLRDFGGQSARPLWQDRVTPSPPQDPLRANLSKQHRTDCDEAVLVMAIFGLHSLMLAQQSEAARITDGWHSACLTR